MALAAAIVEEAPGSLMVPELANVVDTTKVLLAILRIPLALVILRVAAAREAPTAYVVAPVTLSTS